MKINDDTRHEILKCLREAMDAHLKDIKEKKFAYKVICDETNNPPESIKNGWLHFTITNQE